MGVLEGDLGSVYKNCTSILEYMQCRIHGFINRFPDTCHTALRRQ